MLDTNRREVFPQATSDGEESFCTGIEALIQRFEEHIHDGELKMTVGDYIRLLQVKRELATDDRRDIEVRWVDPFEITSSPGQ